MILSERVLDNGLQIDVCAMTFGKARICLGIAPTRTNGYEDGWCYESAAVALAAAEVWDGEGDPPDGWHRQLSTGRRRTDGDPAQEYVRR
jgi:hypothetical protein